MTDDRPPAHSPRTRRPRPRIRGRWALLVALAPPATILACGGAVLTYRLSRADWPGLRLFPTRVTTIRRSPIPVLTRVLPPAPVPVFARIKADPAPILAPTAIPAEPQPVPEPEPVTVAKIAPLPDLKPAEAFVQPQMPEPISKEEALAAIAREAAQLRADRRIEDGLKSRAAAREQAETRARQAEQARRAVHFVEDSRYTFHDQLARLVATGDEQDAERIEALCQRRKIAMPPELRRTFNEARISVSARLERRDRVEFYRRRGVPEETILFELANEELAHVGVRNGPRNRNGALLAAARRLLNVPLPPRSPAAVANAEAHPGGAQAARP